LASCARRGPDIATWGYLPVAPDDIVALLYDRDGATPSMIGSVCGQKLPSKLAQALK
jgi:hypothetical protein